MRQSGFRVPALFIVLGLFAALVTTPARASSLAESVVNLSPLGAIADQSRAMMKAGIRDGLIGTGQVEPFVAETIAGIGSQAFHSGRIRASLAGDLARELDDGQLQTVEQWYRSDLGQRVAQLEADAAAPEAWGAIESAAPGLKKRFDGGPRQQQFARYDRAAGVTDSAVDTAMAAQLAMADALAMLSEGDSAETIRAQVRENRPVIERRVRDQVYLTYLYLYQSLSAQELANYLEFLESPDGSAFTASAGKAVRAAVMERVDVVGNQLVRLLGTGGQ